MRYKGFEPLSTIVYRIRKFKTLGHVLFSGREPPRKIESQIKAHPPIDNTISYADKVYEDRFINRELYDTPDISYNLEPQAFHQPVLESQSDMMNQLNQPMNQPAEKELADRLGYENEELEGLDQMFNQGIADDIADGIANDISDDVSDIVRELEQGLEQELYDELMQDELELLNNPFLLR